MNQLEQFRRTMRRERQERFLYYASFTPPMEARFRAWLGVDEKEDLGTHFGMFQPVSVALRPPAGWEKPDFGKYFAEIEKKPGAFINHLGVLETPGSLYHFTSYLSPLREAETLAEVMDFPYPSVEGFSGEHLAAEVEEAHRAGKVTGMRLTHLYEDSWQIRGYTEFLMDMVEAPEICDYVLDRVQERNLAKARAAAKAGVDILYTGDDVANQRTLMFAPELWRRFIKSRWAEVYATAKAIHPDIKIWYHSDGNIETIIPELIEIGVDILNPLQPECLDLVELKRRYGDKLVFDGTIGTQTTMPFAAAAGVREAVRRSRRELGRDGGLILSPTHVLEPEVPPENIEAFFDACREAEQM